MPADYPLAAQPDDARHAEGPGSHPAQVRDLVSKVVTQFGGLDLIANSAKRNGKLG
jgi:NAD(P)-dependent dehydrogenase (short-subunit alcohol dehydrogenase family)